MRVRKDAEPGERAVLGVMRDLAARSHALAVDVARYERDLAELVRSLDPTLLDETGAGRSRQPNYLLAPDGGCCVKGAARGREGPGGG